MKRFKKAYNDLIMNKICILYFDTVILQILQEHNKIFYGPAMEKTFLYQGRELLISWNQLKIAISTCLLIK